MTISHPLYHDLNGKIFFIYLWSVPKLTQVLFFFFCIHVTVHRNKFIYNKTN